MFGRLLAATGMALSVSISWTTPVSANEEARDLSSEPVIVVGSPLLRW